VDASIISELAPGTRITAARVRRGSALLFALPASHLLNASVPLDLLWSRRQAGEIERLQDWPNCDSRRVALEHALLRALEDRTPDREVLAGVRWLASHPQGRVEQLSRRLGLSARQLQRRFTSVVGYGPKMFQSALALSGWMEPQLPAMR
jgi:AraC-like DNA-binding protein